jgi:hypothetical protein
VERISKHAYARLPALRLTKRTARLQEARLEDDAYTFCAIANGVEWSRIKFAKTLRGRCPCEEWPYRQAGVGLVDEGLVEGLPRVQVEDAYRVVREQGRHFPLVFAGCAVGDGGKLEPPNAPPVQRERAAEARCDVPPPGEMQPG